MPSGLRDRLRGIAPWLLAALLLAVFIALFAWQIAAWLEITGIQESPDSVAPPVTRMAPDLDRLNVLFGTPARPQPSAQGGGDLSILLHGSFVSADPERSSALLQVGDQPARRYRVGDELTQGIVLHRVYANRVQVRRNGRLETLSFPKTGGAGVAIPEPFEALPPSPNEMPVSDNPESAPAPLAPSGPPPGVFDPPPEAVPDVPGRRAP